MQELDQKIDDIVTDKQAQAIASDVVREEQYEMDYSPAADDPVETETGIQQDPMVIEALVAGVDQANAESGEVEGVQVAGLFKESVKFVSKKVAEAEKKVIPGLPDEPIQEVGGKLLIREMPEEEVADINAAMGGDYIKSLNLPAISENMGDADMAEWFAQFKAANAGVIEDARRGTIGIDALIGLANDIGADDMVERLIKRKTGQPLNAEEIVGGVLAVQASFRKTRELFEAAAALPDSVEKRLALAKWAQMMTLTQRLSISVSGGGSEAARATYAMGALQRTLDMPRIEDIANDFERLLGPNGPETIEHLGILYGSIPTVRGKNKFLAQASGALDRGMDVISEIWINSILSLPVTHAVNIAGNAVFMGLRNIERFVASGVGKARGAITGNTDHMTFRESSAHVMGMLEALGDAFLVAGKTLKTEVPADGVTKIDVRRMQAIGNTGDLGEIADQWRNGNITAAVTNTLGVSMRMGGRFLLAEDAFFKGIAYRGAVRAEAEMVAANVYDQAIAAGKSQQQAAYLAAIEKGNMLTTPNTTVIKKAQTEAEIATFQDNLDGFFGAMQSAASHPLAKIVVPFFKTPTNAMKQTAVRSPLMLLYPNFYRTIKAGGREADLAIARVATGSGVMALFSMYGGGLMNEDSDTFIMGSGPPTPAEKQALARKGIQPYSVNIKNYDENGNWDGTYTSIQYSRLDPLSGMLAMAADFTYYSNYEEDQSKIEALAMAATIGMQEYMMQLPLLQGVSELTNILAERNTYTKGEKLIEFFSRKATETGLSVIPGASSFSAGIERQRDPVVKSTMLPEEGLFGEDPTELPAFARGFYQELQRMKARNPFFSDAVEPKLNLWAEKITAGTGEAWEFWSPIRIQDSKYAPLDDEILRIGQGIQMPTKKQNNVLLNATQYNKLLTIMNKADSYGEMPQIEIDGKMQKNPNYRPGETLRDDLKDLMKDPDYRYAEKELQYEAFSAAISARRRMARDILFSQDPDLARKLKRLQKNR